MTKQFNASGKIFSYHHIKREAFTGYAVYRQGGISALIAEPEKAFVDLAYLRLRKGKELLSRFDNRKINPAKALRWARLFNNQKLTGIIKTTFRCSPKRQ
jgi:hypothetical protein